jgi:hypothetical protein
MGWIEYDAVRQYLKPPIQRVVPQAAHRLVLTAPHFG